MNDKIKEIMSMVFDVDSSKIVETTSKDDLEKWDSIGHMNLITSLEEEFGISLSDDELLEMLNFKLICKVIEDKLERL